MEDKNIDVKQRIDIVWLFKYLYNKRLFIIKIVSIGVICGLVTCLCRPKVYKVEASLLPISEDKSKFGNLGSLASMAGIDMSVLNPSSSIITSDLYPRVATSVPFLLQMADVKLKWIKPDTVMSTYEYIKSDTIMTFGKYLRAYTIGLPNTIMKKIRGAESEENVIANTPKLLEEPQYLKLNKYQKSAIINIRDKITIEEDPVTNLIVVSAKGESPIQASVLATEAVNQLQSTISAYKTKQARLSLNFIEDRYKETLDEYEQIREAFFLYKDTHRDMIDERVDVEYQRLDDEYQISYSVLKSLASQMEQAKIKLMEDSPAFSVVDPVVVPLASEKYSPKMKLHLIVGFLLGGIFSIGWLLLQIAYWQVFDPEKVEKLVRKFE